MEVFRCGECEFEYDLDRAPGAGPAIVSDVKELAGLLSDDASDLRSRREPGVWSPLEYGCHVRDVLFVQRERVLAAQIVDRPSSVNPMYREERVALDGYAEQKADDVVRQLSDAALLFSNVVSRLGPTQWERGVIYGYPEPQVRSLRWVAVHTEHEARHHLRDVRSQLF
jgi:DinB superfamily